MSQTTTNYGFTKPELTDVPDITVLSQNWEMIDSILKSIDMRNKLTIVSEAADANSYATRGVYFLNNAINVPSEGKSGLLFVEPWSDSLATLQFWVERTTHEIYLRVKDYSWSAWSQISTHAYFEEFSTELQTTVQSTLSAFSGRIQDNYDYIDTVATALREQIGNTLVTDTIDSSLDHSKAYVYIGTSTADINKGDWIYYDGTAWKSGGVYNSEGYQTDKTLTVPDMAADAKVVGGEIDDLKSALTQIENDATDAIGAYPTLEESGNIITTKSGADNIPVSDFSAVCDCLQDAGTPSLTSVKYIKPHYYIDVVMAKKNLFGGIAFANAVKKANPNATIDVENGTVLMQAISNRIYVSGFFKANTRYSIIFYGKNTTTTTSTNVYVVYTDGTREQLAFSSSSVEAFARYYTLEGKTVQCIQSAAAYFDTLFYYDRFGIFEGDVAISDFVPFDGVAYAINLPETLSSLYGAIIEKIGDNEYKITRTHIAVNLGSLTWTYASGTFRTTIDAAKYQGSCKCECFEYVKIQDLSELQDGQIASTNSQELNFFRVKADNYSTVESFVSAVNNMLLVYELYEPIVYTVSGDEIKTIFGENNIYTNVGSVSSIGIRNDTALYVDSKVPEYVDSKVPEYVDSKVPEYVDSKVQEYVDSKVPELEEYDIPVLYFNGEVADMTKKNEKKLALSYHSPSSMFDCYVKMKWQGNSSLVYPKKNYTIKLYSDSACTTSLTKDFGWGSQSKYCIKANWIDFSMARNICSAKLWGRFVKNRTGVDPRLSALPNGGAVDGFPVAVVINGEYKGLYTFNIPKEGWMFGMGSATTEAIVCADGYGTATQFNQLAELDGSDFKLEYDGGAGTETIKTSLNRLIQTVMDATSENFDSTVGQYLDINSAIDYYIFTCMLGGGDMVEKNYLLATYDGIKWFFSAYDMDTTFGLAWDGSGFSSAYSYPMFATYTEHNLLMDKLYDYKLDAIKARYVALRKFQATDFAFQYIVYQFAKDFPKGLKNRELDLWAALPSTDVSNAAQITTWFAQRLKLLDTELNVTP